MFQVFLNLWKKKDKDKKDYISLASFLFGLSDEEFKFTKMFPKTIKKVMEFGSDFCERAPNAIENILITPLKLKYKKDFDFFSSKNFWKIFSLLSEDTNLCRKTSYIFPFILANVWIENMPKRIKQENKEHFRKLLKAQKKWKELKIDTIMPSLFFSPFMREKKYPEFYLKIGITGILCFLYSPIGTIGESYFKDVCEIGLHIEAKMSENSLSKDFRNGKKEAAFFISILRAIYMAEKTECNEIPSFSACLSKLKQSMLTNNEKDVILYALISLLRYSDAEKFIQIIEVFPINEENIAKIIRVALRKKSYLSFICSFLLYCGFLFHGTTNNEEITKKALKKALEKIILIIIDAYKDSNPIAKLIVDYVFIILKKFDNNQELLVKKFLEMQEKDFSQIFRLILASAKSEMSYLLKQHFEYILDGLSSSQIESNIYDNLNKLLDCFFCDIRNFCEECVDQIKSLSLLAAGGENLVDAYEHHIFFPAPNMSTEWYRVNETKALDLVRNFHQLEKVNLTWGEIGHEGLRVLCDYLKENQLLQELNLSWNKLNDRDAELVLDMLRRNVTLFSVLLYPNGISDEVMVQIRQKLRRNRLLQKRILNVEYDEKTDVTVIDLSYCGLDGDSILSAMSLMENLPAISLNLSYNNITNNGAIALADGLKANKTIEKLILIGNYITAEGAKRLLTTTKSHPMIEKVDLSQNIVSIEYTDLCELISASKRSVELDISQNYVGCTSTSDFPKQKRLEHEGAIQIMLGSIGLQSRLKMDQYKKQLKDGRDIAVVRVVHQDKLLGHIFINFGCNPPVICYALDKLSREYGLWRALAHKGARKLKPKDFVDADIQEQVITEVEELPKDEAKYLTDKERLKQHLILLRTDTFRNKPTKQVLMANLVVNQGIFKSSAIQTMKSHIDPKYTISRNQCVIYLACTQDNKEHAILFIEGMRSFGQMYLLKAHFGPKKGISRSKAHGINDIFGEGAVEIKLFDIYRFLDDLHNKKEYILTGWEVPRISDDPKKIGIKELLQKMANEATKQAPPYFKLESTIFKPLKLFSKSAQSQTEQSYNCLTWALEKLELLGITVETRWITKSFPKTSNIIKEHKKLKNKKCLIM